MPVEMGIWRMGESLKQLSPSQLDSEAMLEDFLEKEPNLLDTGVMIIGRQVATDSGQRVDLLGVDVEGREADSLSSSC